MKILAMLLTLVMVVGLLPGMSASAAGYGLTVGTVIVDDDYISDYNVGWSFDPVNNTLRLNNANIGGKGIEYTGQAPLNIELSGTNSVSVTSGNAISSSNISGPSLNISDISGTGSLTVSGSSGGIFCLGTLEIRGGTVTAEGTGNNSVGIFTLNGLTISGGTVTAIGGVQAIQGSVKNSIPGKGWSNTEGTQGEKDIPVSADGQFLPDKKVVFKESVTVTLRPNGGSGEDIVSTVAPNGTYELPPCNYNPPEGKTFTGWKLRQDGKTYKPGQKFTVTSALDFDAQWGEPAPDGGVDLVFNIPGADNSWEYVGGYVAPQLAYRVSLAPMQGGSAALGLTTGESGTALNVYPTTTVFVFSNAEQGYVLDKIVWSLIDGSASYDITEAKNFVMPAMDVVMYVTFRPVG